MDRACGGLLFHLLALHRLGQRLLSRSVDYEEVQEKIAAILINNHLAEGEREIAFFYLALASSVLTSQSRHALIEYASDPAHGDVVAQKGSARDIIRANFLEVLREMEVSHAAGN